MTQPHHDAQSERVDAATVRAWLAQPDTVTVLDVRTPAEFETVHIRGSYNVPLNLLDQHAEQLAARLDRHVVLVCQSGPRAAQARQRLAAVGADRVHVLDGGITAYARSGGDGGGGDGEADGSLVRGRARWSLERQVRLVAGTLVLAGLVAGLRAPRARLLSAGIGAGLTVSALTDTCTMARVLSALPYNRGARDRTPAEVLAQLPTGAAARPAPSSAE
jgi:rhodanese-related sulfurtransferase